MIKNFDSFLFRCSGLGNIVTKSGELTDGSKTYLLDVFIGEVQGVKKEAYGKPLEKGNACEPDGLKMLNDIFYPNLYVPKIKDSSFNEWVKGTADTIKYDTVTDIKNAWDRFTFGKAALTHLYEWQLKGYMFLYDLPKGRLFYCLINLPDHMIAGEQMSMFYKSRDRFLTQDSDEFKKACDELEQAHNYDNLKIWERFKVWEIERNEKDDEKIKDCILKSRTYLNGLLYKYKEMIEQNKKIAINNLKQ